MRKTLIFMVFLLGVVYLQIFLSKKENKYLGLVLPIISLINPLMVFLGYATFSSFTTTTLTEDGGAVISTVTSGETIATSILPMLVAALVAGIPTIILFAIYFACREKIKQNKELTKMKIDDL